MDTIPVLVDDGGSRGREGMLGAAERAESAVRDLDVDKLKSSLAHISEKISHLLQDIKEVGSYKLKEVQVAVEINAEGGVALIGSLKAGAKGAVTLTFAP